MKKNPIVYIISMFYALPALADEALSEALKSSHQMNYGSIIMSLIFVIILIYVTGIMYTKLNKFGLKTIKKEFKNFPEKAVIISTTPVGNNKTLQVIEIEGERLLIGVTPNSINLIKSLGKVEEKFEEEIVEPTQETIKKEEETTINVEELGLYKKYLR